MKPVLESSVFTHSFQPNDLGDPNSKRMGTGNVVPWRMARSGMEKANGTQETSKSRCSRDSATQSKPFLPL